MLFRSDELIEPIQEREILEESKDSPYAFPEGDKEIVAQVLHEHQMEQGEIIEVDESDGEDVDPAGDFTRHEAMELASKLEPVVIKYGDPFGPTLE